MLDAVGRPIHACSILLEIIRCWMLLEDPSTLVVSCWRLLDVGCCGKTHPHL
jgi:hypothetical protein